MVRVGSIYKRFGGNFLNKDEFNIQRPIIFPGFTRLGFELNGIFLNQNILSVVCWGAHESEFLNTLPEEKQIEVLERIIRKNPPLFVLSHRFTHVEKLLHLNKTINENRSAIIYTQLATTEIYALIGIWLTKALANWKSIHGTVLNIWGEGVLLIGDPGVGKSEAASELIKKNHLFLGDDAISVARLGNTVIAKPNELTKDFIHLRGLGILNIKEMYGVAKIINDTQISMVILLKRTDMHNPNQSDFENLGEEQSYYDLVGVSVPIYTLPVTSGRNIADLIETAVIHMKLKKQGYSAIKDIDKKCQEKINNPQD